MPATYGLGYRDLHWLRALAETQDAQAALERLDDLRGSAADVRLAARLYERAGRFSDAARMLELVDGLGE